MKAHLSTPGMAVAMAYGFVACENTVKYKMEKWYEEEKARMEQEINAKQFLEDVGECSKTLTDPVKSNKSQNLSHEVVKSKATHQETKLDAHDQQLQIGMPSRRNSKMRRSFKSSQLDDIPEAGEEHLETK